MEINSVSSSAALQNSGVAEQENRRQNEIEENNTPQTPASQDTVSISSESVTAASETAQQTNIQDSQQAEAAASRVVELFQNEPELAATAQGGRVTAEKVDAFLSANIGG